MMTGVGAETLKREAAARALEHVESGMALGLGTGSTVAHFLDLLGKALETGALRDVVGVPSSVRTSREARQAGVRLVNLQDRLRLDLTVDGADEISPDLDLVKGMGGALVREKIVAEASARFVVIADESKAVERLGTVSPLPVEVVAWGWGGHVALLEEMGAQVTLRQAEQGLPYKSDNGNFILDCRFGDGIADPKLLHATLRARAGVVDTGLFLDMAEEAILAGAGGVRVLRRAP